MTTATALAVPIEAVVADAGWTVARNRGPADVLGFVYRNADHRVIGVNTAASPRRQRYAIAHAYAHGQLHRGRPLILCHSMRPDVPPAPDAAATERQEVEARDFALDLLLPESAVADLLRREVVAGDFASRDELIGRLGRAFEVSEAAMGYRLIALGLVSP